ncbi:MAG: phage head-tail connector protein [Bacillota bacterium]|nr:phage head-tail connector protein [Bacillota bacterium]
MTLDEKLAALYSDVDDNKLLVYRGMATDAIKNYLNLDSNVTQATIEATYESALIQLIGNKINQDDAGNIKSYTMSKTSVTYANNSAFGISDDIKVLLPSPYIKLLGSDF